MAALRSGASGVTEPASNPDTSTTANAATPNDRPATSATRPSESRGPRQALSRSTNARSVTNDANRNDAPITPPPVARNNHTGTDSDSGAAPRSPPL